MHPQLQEVHIMARKAAREFVERAVEPNARRIDGGWYPRELLREMGKLGLLAPMVPEEYGGPGLDFRTAVVVVEEVAKASPSLATVAEIQGTMSSYTLLHYADPAVRERWLPQAAQGEKVVAYSLSEPCCGSDVTAMETRAERAGGEWTIRGVKLWTTSGMYADAYIVAARTGEGRRDITLFLVERDSCISTSPIEVMGIRGTGTAEVRFDGCRVGDDAVLGKVNGGFSIILEELNNGRMSVGAIGLGIAEGALEEAWGYVRRRRAFGGVLADLQAVQHRLAEVKAGIEAVRSVVYTAAHFRDTASPLFPMYAQVAKLLGSRLAVDSTRAAMQLMGGHGYSTDSKVEMLYRDAKATEIYEGANEVILNAIYRLMEKGEG